MNETKDHDQGQERRLEPRKAPDKYYSVQFSVKELAYIYQFKIWNVSSKGICILINEESEILNHLKVGDRLEVKYYLTESQGTTEAFMTEVRHITKNTQGRFKGHYSVGLLMLESLSE